jgi:hypothetical protein
MTPNGNPGAGRNARVPVSSRYNFEMPASLAVNASCRPSGDRSNSSMSQSIPAVSGVITRVERST